MATRVTPIIEEELCLFVTINQDVPTKDMLIAAQERADAAGVDVVFMHVSTGRLVKVGPKSDLEMLEAMLLDRFNCRMLIE